jgi:hypothetical protein
VAVATRHLGVALSEAGEYPEAEARQREALATFTTLDLPLDRASSMSQLAVVFNRVDRTDEAELGTAASSPRRRRSIAARSRSCGAGRRKPSAFAASPRPPISERIHGTSERIR